HPALRDVARRGSSCCQARLARQESPGVASYWVTY
ncbi:hypothetical protein A2U01_0052815, partial [Trifolium medium]|nr:hypothetical protein [Trifolium medium]